MRLPLNPQLTRPLLWTLGQRRVPALTGKQVRYGHGHGVSVNPGPPITYDYMPIPSQPYKRVHAELQKKFNRYLAISLSMLATSAFLAYYFDTFEFETIVRTPHSYRYRKKPKPAPPAEENE